jgi:SAM-dependent methyltransferase
MLPEGEETTWEAVARTTWGTYLTGVQHRVLREGCELAGVPSTALEVGCEGGRWSKLLQSWGWKNICTDINPESIELTRRRLPDAKCILVNANDERLPAEDASVGLILVCEVPVIEAPWFPDEAKRVLRPGGVLVFSHFNPNSYRALLYRIGCRIQRLWGGTHFKTLFYHGPSYRSLRRAICARGFEMTREVGFCWFPFGRKSNSTLIGPAVRMEKFFGLHRLPTVSPWVMSIAQLNGPR